MQPNNIMEVYDENNNKISIEIILNFRIEDYDREYIAYTLNDDGISDDVVVFISGIKYVEDIPVLINIPEDEKEMALMFYNNVKEGILKQEEQE